jgi:hypothetical protein
VGGWGVSGMCEFVGECWGGQRSGVRGDLRSWVSECECHVCGSSLRAHEGDHLLSLFIFSLRFLILHLNQAADHCKVHADQFWTTKRPMEELERHKQETTRRDPERPKRDPGETPKTPIEETKRPKRDHKVIVFCGAMGHR